jgi:hypothetical protein
MHPSERLSEILYERFKAGEITLDLKGHDRAPEGPCPYEQLWPGVRNPQREWAIKRILGSDATMPVAFSLLKKDKGLSEDEAVEALAYHIEDHWDVARHYDDTQALSLSRASCAECGERYEAFYDGKTVSLRGDPCSEPGGRKPWALEIDVPSGVLVFRNDLRPYFPDLDDDPLNTESCGMRGATWSYALENWYAKQGMFHVFVSNTSPAVLDMPDGTIEIGDFREFIWDREKETEVENPDPRWKHSRGSICTDLWWVSACDRDDFLRRGGTLSPESESDYPDEIVIELKKGPGRYRLTSYFSAAGLGEPDLYARIEKV